MIRKEENRVIGLIAKPFGTSGSLLIRLRDIQADDIKKWDWLFVDIDGLLVPFLIMEYRQVSNDSIVVKFENVDSEQEAGHLRGYDVYIDPNKLKKVKRGLTGSVSVKGFKVIDRKLGYIGVAGEVVSEKVNPLLQIYIGNRECLLPVHEDIILNINDQTKEILITAPDGLFEL